MNRNMDINGVTECVRILRGFIGPKQLDTIGKLCRGEEREFFRSKLAELAAIVSQMPSTYETDGQKGDAVAHLHYFVGSCDWWITEKDKGAPDDTPADLQSQAFGLADLGLGERELGYISLPEIFSAGAELDLHWTPKTIAEINHEKAAEAAARFLDATKEEPEEPEEPVTPITFPARPAKGGFDPAKPLVGDWRYEPKLNGWRAMLHLPTGCLYNRHGEALSIGNQFRWATGELYERFNRQVTWVDCEALERRHTILQGWLIVLDLVMPDVPYLERREIMAAGNLNPLEFVPNADCAGLVRMLPSYREDQAEAIWEAMQLANTALAAPLYEGFVAKRADSLYPIQTRSGDEVTPDWVKMRFIYG